MGTLSDVQISRLIDAGAIFDPFEGRDALFSRVQPASLDLALGQTAYRIRSSFLPQGDSVSRLLPELSLYPVDLNTHPYLEKGAVYLIPLSEQLSLPPGVEGKANPKSSTGRVDVFTRVLTEKTHRFDDIPPGYKGHLYLEVFSRSFPLKVKPGLSLSQLRLFENRKILTDLELMDRHRTFPLFWYDGKNKEETEEFRDGVSLGVDLSFEPVVGYKARPNTRVLDLTVPSENPAEPFWEPIMRPSSGDLILEPESFYLLLLVRKSAFHPIWLAKWWSLMHSRASFGLIMRGFLILVSDLSKKGPGQSWKFVPMMSLFASLTARRFFVSGLNGWRARPAILMALKSGPTTADRLSS